MHSPKRIKITDVNPHLICVLCGGYYIDATTIIECLHSFCKSCIVRYLQRNKYCPICDVQVHKTAPLLNIRSDRTLQNIVYKLVPSLFKNEMERRVAFYEKYPGAMPAVPEQRGEITDATPIFFPDEFLMVCLEYHVDHSNEQVGYFWPRRYFHCPAALTVSHLVKLIRGKFGLTNIHHVSIFFKDDLLEEDITIMDIAYTYQCRRKTPIHLMFRILELKKKTIRLMPPIPPNQLNATSQSKAEGQKEEVKGEISKKDESENLMKEKTSTSHLLKENNNEIVILNKANNKESLGHNETHNKVENKLKGEIKSNFEEPASSNIDTNSTIMCIASDETAEKCKIENKNCTIEDKIEKNNGSKLEKTSNGEDLKDCKDKPEQPSPNEHGSIAEGEWKEVQLQISENGVMSVRNMKSSECSPIPAVEAPICSISHPTTSQANSSVMASKVPFANVPQNRNNEPIVSVSKVSKDQVKKEVNHPVVTSENKLSISRVTSPAVGAPIAKGDVLNRIVSKLSPNETVIGNTGVTIRPVTKVYPGMKTVQDRKSRGSSNHVQSRYKTINQTPTWNPSIDRTTMLSMKQNCDLNKPPRFFKMRNAPRYLGNPAEGVKPIYGGGRQEESQSKKSPPKSPVKQPPPYTPRGQDKPPPPYTPRPAHTGCGGGATYLPPNPYHLLYSGFPFAGASPELLRSMCASTAYHPSLPPSISMLYNNPSLQQVPPMSHDAFKVATSTPPPIQRIPSSLSPKPPSALSIEDKKRDLPPPSSSSTTSSSPSLGSFKLHKPLDDTSTKPLPLPPPPIPLPPPPHSLSEKSSTAFTANNNNTKESPLPASINQQHSLK